MYEEENYVQILSYKKARQEDETDEMCAASHSKLDSSQYNLTKKLLPVAAAFLYIWMTHIQRSLCKLILVVYLNFYMCVWTQPDANRKLQSRQTHSQAHTNTDALFPLIFCYIL